MNTVAEELKRQLNPPNAEIKKIHTYWFEKKCVQTPKLSLASSKASIFLSMLRHR